MASRIIFLVFCSTLLTSLVLTGVSTRSMKGFLREKVDQKFPVILAGAAERIELWYSQRKLDIETFSHSEAVSENIASLGREGEDESPAQDVRDYLSYVLERFPQYDALFLLDPSGRQLLWVGEALELPEDLRREIAGVASSGLSPIRLSGEVRVQVTSASILDSWHRPLGSLHALLRLSVLDGVLASDRLGPSGETFLVSNQGHYLTSVRNLPAGGLFTRALPGSGDDVRVSDYRNDRGDHVVGGALRLDRFDWTLVVEENYEEAFKPAQIAIWQVLGINLVIVLIFSGLAYWIAQSMVGPVRALSSAARRIADGKIDVVIEETSSDDEIGLLTRSFNQMLSRLRRNRVELEESRVKIEEANTRLRRQNDELQRMNETLEQLSITDGLTRLYNHRFFQEQLTREIARVEREGTELILALIDIDNFKQLNDRYGHASGDVVLCGVASTMKKVVRESDLLARYGGEEFALLPHKADLDGAISLAEKLRFAISATDTQIDHEGEKVSTRVTVSIGIARYRGDRKVFFNDADRALYQAKASGKDCVVVHSGEDDD